MLAGLGTLALARFTARSTIESELRANATRLAESVTDDSPGNGQRQLPLIRAVLQLQDAGLVLIPDGARLNTTIRGELPPAVDLTIDELSLIQSGGVVSGRSGSVVWAVAAADGASNRILVGLSREIDFELGPGLRYFVLAASMVLLLSAFAARRLADRVTEPIREAEHASRRLAAGDLTVRLAEPAPDDTDEVADLTRSINTMAEALERSRGLERQFLMSVSHDLRTPLTSIRGYAEAISDGTATDGPAAAEVILNESRRLERLVADLLDLAKLDAHRFSLHPSPIDASEELGELAAGFTPDARQAGCVIRLEPTTEVPVFADPDRFAQVVANLLENAIEFASSTIIVGASADGERAVITIDDDGPGIDAADLPHVFERLYVVKRRPEQRETGSGLGLAICRELVVAMGGSIEAGASTTGGARITVRLPAVQP